MNTIQDLVASIQQGQPIILLDSESRENEGDLVIAAQSITPEWINFMSREARGLICLALNNDQVARLGLPMMPSKNIEKSENYTAFTVSVDAKNGIKSGISASDRASTILQSINSSANLETLVSPGHIFPIVGKKGGVLERQGHTEASLELVRLAGLSPGAVLCEILGPSGDVATRTELQQFAHQYGLRMGTVEDLILYVLQEKEQKTLSEPTTLDLASGPVIALDNLVTIQSL